MVPCAVRVLGSDAAEPFAAILAHEERLWCEAMRHRLDSDRLERKFRRHARRIVAALVLRGGAADEEELRALVVSVGGEELREFADVLRELYPGGEGEAGWAPARPGRPRRDAGEGDPESVSRGVRGDARGRRRHAGRARPARAVAGSSAAPRLARPARPGAREEPEIREMRLPSRS